jgi:hypothetical protein
MAAARVIKYAQKHAQELVFRFFPITFYFRFDGCLN